MFPSLLIAMRLDGIDLLLTQYLKIISDNPGFEKERSEHKISESEM